MAYSTATLTGTYQTWDGTPASGTIEIIPNSPALIDAEGDVILSGRVKVTLDETGAFDVDLPATDDETVEPAIGRQYTVVAKLRHQHLKAVTGIELAGGETVDMADVTSAAETTASLSLFLTAEEYAGVVARVADLEAAPAVTKATLGLGSVDNTSDAAKPVSTAQRGTFAAFGPTPQAHGAAGNGTTDDTAALQAWLAAGYSEGFVPPGTYLTTATLTQPATMDVVFAPGAKIKASAVIAGPIWDTPLATLARNRKLINPWFDCDAKAQTGLYLRYAAHFEVTAPRVTSATSHSIILGDPGSVSASYEISVADINVERPSGQAVPAGSYGLWMRYAQDSRIHGSNVILGAGVGVRMERGSNQFEDIHVWGYPGYAPTIAFDDASGHNVYIGCMADSPSQYGWKFSAFKARLIGCHAYVGVNYTGIDNTVTGMYTTLDAPDVDLIGCHFEGADVTHRLAKDFDGASALWPPYVNAIGTHWDQVVTKNIVTANQLGATRFRDTATVLATSANALAVRNAAGTYVANANTGTGSERFEVLNAAELRGYSDNFTSTSWQIMGGSGLMRAGRFTTAGRPTGAQRVTGGIGYDVTLQKYVYFDGTNWKDFAGTTV